MKSDGVRVDVGAWDWQRPVWRREYYPEELPEEWRAAYYANEYRCAGLPAHAWSVESLAAWREDLPETFSLWMEVGPAQLAEAGSVQALVALGSRLAGVWASPEADLAMLRAAGIRVIAPPREAWRHGDEAAAGLYRPGAELDLRAARGMLEAFAFAPGPLRRQLLVAGSPAQLARLRELGELLGL
ncbi:MAG: hypothetical protein P8Y78_00755 [Acidihalobacter sp.]